MYILCVSEDAEYAGCFNEGAMTNDSSFMNTDMTVDMCNNRCRDQVMKIDCFIVNTCTLLKG